MAADIAIAIAAVEQRYGIVDHGQRFEEGEMVRVERGGRVSTTPTRLLVPAPTHGSTLVLEGHVGEIPLLGANDKRHACCLRTRHFVQVVAERVAQIVRAETGRVQ